MTPNQSGAKDGGEYTKAQVKEDKVEKTKNFDNHEQEHHSTSALLQTTLQKDMQFVFKF
jgi:hypothetical protein